MQVPPLAQRAPFALYLALVAVAGVYGGLGPALLAIALSAPITAYWFLPPVGFQADDDSLVRLGAFVLLAGLIGLVNAFRMVRLPDVKPSADIEGYALG